MQSQKQGELSAKYFTSSNIYLFSPVRPLVFESLDQHVLVE